jgi:hypothetical protein
VLFIQKSCKVFYAIKLKSGGFLYVTGFGYQRVDFPKLVRYGLYTYEETAMEDLTIALAESTIYMDELDVIGAEVVPIQLSEL